MARRTKSNEFIAEAENYSRIYVGDFIHFIFNGNDMQGRILKQNGKLYFKYKTNEGFHIINLSSLQYNTKTDWYFNNEFSYHLN